MTSSHILSKRFLHSQTYNIQSSNVKYLSKNIGKYLTIQIYVDSDHKNLCNIYTQLKKGNLQNQR